MFLTSASVQPPSNRRRSLRGASRTTLNMMGGELKSASVNKPAGVFKSLTTQKQRIAVLQASVHYGTKEKNDPTKSLIFLPVIWFHIRG